MSTLIDVEPVELLSGSYPQGQDGGMARGRLPTTGSLLKPVESAPHSARKGRLLRHVHAGEAPAAAPAMIRTRREGRGGHQGPHILQVDRPLAPLAA